MIHFFPSRTVALELFGFGIHWYGLLYLVSFLLAWFLLPRLQKLRKLDLSHDEWSTILSYAVIGVIVGGRLGFVLFYEPGDFLRAPLQIFAVWNGGMSSHGGLLGVVVALWFALSKRKSKLWQIADIVVVPAAIGLALGRIGNFVNLELYGTVTTLPWCIDIPGVQGCRHPTQFYAVIKDLFIAGLCYWYLLRKPVLPGRTFALFLMAYGTLRFLVEYFRDQEYGFINLGILHISWGQLYTIPLIVAGVVLWRLRGKTSA